MSLPVMIYGAVLSAVLAVVLLIFAGRDRRPAVLAAAAAAALLMPVCWNLILRATGATAAFSHDLPFRPFPISWQDTGSGVFALAALALILGLGPLHADRGRRVALLAALGAFGALLVDIYLY